MRRLKVLGNIIKILIGYDLCQAFDRDRSCPDHSMYVLVEACRITAVIYMYAQVIFVYMFTSPYGALQGLWTIDVMPLLPFGRKLDHVVDTK